MDGHDRGRQPKPSALTPRSETPSNAWVQFAAEINRLATLLPPEGHTAEMIADRVKAGGKYLAERYASRPEALEATRQVITRGIADRTWTKFPPPSVLIERIDSWLGWEAGAADRDKAMQEARARQASLERRQLELHANQMRKVEAMKAAGKWPPPGWVLDDKGRLARIVSTTPPASPLGSRTWKHLA